MLVSCFLHFSTYTIYFLEPFETNSIYSPSARRLTSLSLQDSVPKFVKEPKYANVLREHNFDHIPPGVMPNHSPSHSTLPERTLSKAARPEARDPRG